jgi:hypothetical protein
MELTHEQAVQILQGRVGADAITIGAQAAVINDQAAQIEALTARVTELEAPVPVLPVVEGTSHDRTNWT